MNWRKESIMKGTLIEDTKKYYEFMAEQEENPVLKKHYEFQARRMRDYIERKKMKKVL